jgi:hypothetical protein
VFISGGMLWENGTRFESSTSNVEY